MAFFDMWIDLYNHCSFLSLFSFLAYTFLLYSLFEKAVYYYDRDLLSEDRLINRICDQRLLEQKDRFIRDYDQLSSTSSSPFLCPWTVRIEYLSSSRHEKGGQQRNAYLISGDAKVLALIPGKTR